MSFVVYKLKTMSFLNKAKIQFDLIYIIILLCSVSSVAIGQSTWNANGDGISWSDANNWNNGVPDQVGNAAIPSGDTVTVGSDIMIDWTSGDLSGGGTLINLGTINVQTAGTKLIVQNSVLHNKGNINHHDGSFFLNNGTVLNEGQYTFKADNDNITFASGTLHDFINNGILTKDGGNAVTNINAVLRNSGTIEVKTGTLKLANDGLYSTGSQFVILNSAILDFSSGKPVLEGQITGNSDGLIDMGSFFVVPNSASIDIGGNGISCTTCHFQGGGEVTFLDKLILNASNKVISDSTTVIIQDSLIHDDGALFLNDGTLINNGTYILTNDNDNISQTSGTIHNFINNGSLIKDGGSATTTIMADLQNSGAVIVRTGTLKMDNDGLYATGSEFIVLNGGVLDFATGSPSLDGFITGNSQGLIDMGSNFIIPNSASIDISDNGVSCTTCHFQGGGEVNFLDKLLLTGFSKVISDSTTVTVQDTVIHQDGSLFVNSGTLINEGVYIFSGDGDNISRNVSNGLSRFINRGDIIKDGGPNRTTVGLNTSNYGNVTVKTGELDINISLTSSKEKSRYKGISTIDIAGIPADDNVSGVFDPGCGNQGVGTLIIEGNIDTARFTVDIIGDPSNYGIDYDYVDISGEVSVIDSIEIVILELPKVGDTYTIAKTNGIDTIALSDTITAMYEDLTYQFKVYNSFSRLQLEYIGLHGTPEFIALVALYDSTDGDNWNNNFNWKKGHPCGPTPWSGIGCDSMNRITNLYLNNRNMNGAIPVEIGQLEYLESINFSGNPNLISNIPPEIENLKMLERFHVSNSGLIGKLPEEITRLPLLRDIRLQFNDLTGSLPTNLNQLSNLEILLLNDNKLEGFINSDISELSKLRLLYLYNNKFSGTIPQNIGQLSSITDLRLSGNRLSGTIPKTIGELDNMERLWLQNNQLEGGIPSSIADCSSLVSFFVVNNPKMEGCYDTRLQLLNSQWNASNASISMGTNMASWESFIQQGAGTCCLDSINEDCTVGPCDFFDNAFWQAEGSVIYSGSHRINNGVSVRLNSSEFVELNSTIEVKSGGNLEISMVGCDVIDPNADIPPPDTAGYTSPAMVIIPDGVDITYDELELISHLESFEIDELGNSQYIHNEGERQIAVIINQDFDPILTGFITDDLKEISVQSTVITSLYQALGTMFLSDTINQLFIERYEELPGIDSLVTAAEEMFLLDPLFLSKDQFNKMIVGVVDSWRTDAEVINLFKSVNANGDDMRSGIQLKEKSAFEISIVNSHRRIACALIYKTESYDLNGTKTTIIDDIASSNGSGIKETVPIKSPIAITGFIGTLKDWVSNVGTKFAAQETNPINLPLTDTESRATYCVRVIGPSSRPLSNGMNPVEFEKYKTVQIQTAIDVFLLPAVLNLIDQNDALGIEDLAPLKNAMVTFITSLPSVQNKIIQGDFKGATKDFMINLTTGQIAGGASDFLDGFLDGLAGAYLDAGRSDYFIQNAGRAKFALKKLTKFLDITDKLLTASNFGKILYDLNTSEGIEEWCVDVKRGNVTLKPNPGVAFPFIELPITAITKNTQLAPGQSFEYEWSTSGTYGILKDDIHEGTSFSSSSNNVNYFSEIDDANLPDDAEDKVYVEVFIKQGLNKISVGKDTTSVRVRPYEFEIFPDGAHLRGNSELTLKIFKPVNEDVISQNPSLDYKIVWSSSGRYGNFKEESTRYNTNSITYDCIDTDVMNGVEQVTAHIYGKLKTEDNNGYELYDVLSKQVAQLVLHMP